jgi:ribonuclease HII
MGYIIGFDEVGRGALAGPVVVAGAMILARDFKIGNRASTTLKDSKKLSAKQRESWYVDFIKNPRVIYAIARVYPREIEKRNISAAANLAALRVYKKLINISKNRVVIAAMVLDGGLYLGSKKWQEKNLPYAKTLPKADENISAVAIASIIAKVHRDRFMVKMAKKYPQYGFEVHKGYGTKKHLAAIRVRGACPIHRLTFLKKPYKMDR